MAMVTRKSSDLENKLKLAMAELKKSKDLNDKLLLEQKESEDEMLHVLHRNTTLKNELKELDTQLEDMQKQRDQLQLIIHNYDKCRETYETALDQIRYLEKELQLANNKLKSYEQQKQSHTLDNTLTLYDELVGINCSPIVTIDLTNSVCNESIGNKDKLDLIRQTKSHNKLKKFIKINKFIKKCHLKYKANLRGMKTINLKLHNIGLRQELLKYEELVDRNNLQLESLSNKIKCLQLSLEQTTTQYEAACKDIDDYASVLDEITELGKSNLERLQSLTCKSSFDSVDNYDVYPNHQQCHEQEEQHTIALLNQTIDLPVPYSVPKTLIISDRLGKGFGSVFSYCLNQTVLNICTPDVTLKNLIKNIPTGDLNGSSTVVILFGNSLSLRKSDLIGSIEFLLQVHHETGCKFVMSGFPYFSNVSAKQNRHIYDFNMHLYNLTHRHNDAIFYFDINKFIHNFRLSHVDMHMPIRAKRQIATLVACNIQSLVLRNDNEFIDSPNINLGFFDSSIDKNCVPKVPSNTYNPASFGHNNSLNTLDSDPKNFL